MLLPITASENMLFVFYGNVLLLSPQHHYQAVNGCHRPTLHYDAVHITVK